MKESSSLLGLMRVGVGRGVLLAAWEEGLGGAVPPYVYLIRV